MTSVFAARRRAEEFNSLVEDASTGKSSDARYAELADLVAQLRALEPPAPRPEFTASLRAELMDAADTLLQPAADSERLTLPARPTARDRRFAVAVGGLAIVGATTSLAVAAQSALPGEMLYPLKRALETAETHVQTSQQAKAASLLADATTRLDEATELTRGGDLGDTPSIAASFTDFADQAQQASRLVLDSYAESGDQSTVERLNAFTVESMDTLTRLEDMVPTDAHDELLHAARVLERIDAEAARACPSCRGGITQLPSMLLTADGAPTGSTTVVVPGATLPATDGGDAPKGNRDERTQKGSADSGGLDVTEPLTGDGVTTPPDTGGDGGSGDSPTGPLDDLTDELIGTGGDGGGGGGGGATTGNDGLDDTVDGLGETIDNAVDDVTEGLGDSVTDLP